MFDTKNIIDSISLALEKNDEIAPFLFTWSDLEKLNYEVLEFISKLFLDFWVNKNNLFKISDNGETIKVKDIRFYLEKSFIKTDSLFQVFYIENVSRLTEERANAMLKFLEEPWVWNIVFLTNSWENKILETILSRVKLINTKENISSIYDEKYYMYLENFYFEKDFYIFSYFYREKLEKEDYILFLKTFLYFIEKNLVLVEFVDEIYDTLNQIISQPIVAKYHVDKILLKLQA